LGGRGGDRGGRGVVVGETLITIASDKIPSHFIYIVTILFYMVKQILSGLTAAFFLIGCNSHPVTKAGKDSLASPLADGGQQKIANNPGTFTIDPVYDSTRPVWVSFAIGVIYGPPDFYVRNGMDSSNLSWVYDEGVDDLKSAGIHVDKEQYKAYLRDFKGDLLICGQPESRERLWVWYKPASLMITYFQP
jgi:hypothetical protein